MTPKVRAAGGSPTDAAEALSRNFGGRKAFENMGASHKNEWGT